MKHLFLDTNILFDVVLDRAPFSEQGAKIFDLRFNNQLKLYTSSLSYSTVYYVLKKSNSHTATITILKKLNELIETIDVTDAIIKKSLYSDFSDFEDAIQNFSAKSNKKIDAIVTRNQKDFKKSDLLVLSPEEALAIVKK